MTPPPASDLAAAVIAEFRHRQRIATEVEAVRQLIDAGLRAESKAAQRKAELAAQRAARKGVRDAD